MTDHPSHSFSNTTDEEIRCMYCDCRPNGTAASKPCVAFNPPTPAPDEHLESQYDEQFEEPQW